MEDDAFIHPSSRDDINLKRRVARGFHEILGSTEASGEFDVFMRDGVLIGIRRKGQPIDLERLTPGKLEFYVQEPFSAYFKERRNLFRLNKGVAA